MNNTETQSDFTVAYVLNTHFKESAKLFGWKRLVPVRADYDGWLSAWAVRLQKTCIPQNFKQHNHG